MNAPRTDREPVLDGIRGVAILLVLGHHAIIYAGMGRDSLADQALHTLGASSWLGVDLFFVLSGFLITGILYDARASSTYFTSFYGRRFLRLFPLYYGFLAAWLVIVPLAVPGDRGAQLTSGLAWHWAYLSNVQVARSGWQEPLHLGHFWSLAIEEQFYLTWPFVVRAFDRRRLMQLCVLLFVSACALRVLTPFGLSLLDSHVLMITRMDSLAAGGFLALALRGPHRAAALGVAPHVLLIGCSLLGGGIFVWRRGFGEQDPVVATVGLSVFAVAFAALIAVSIVAAPRSSLRRILSASPLIVLGQYSYGVYVFHQPIAIFLRDAGWQADMLPRMWGSEWAGTAAFAGMVTLASLGCAVTSWHLWETHFLALKRYLPYGTSGPSLAGPPGAINSDRMAT